MRAQLDDLRQYRSIRSRGDADIKAQLQRAEHVAQAAVAVAAAAAGAKQSAPEHEPLGFSWQPPEGEQAPPSPPPRKVRGGASGSASKSKGTTPVVAVTK